MTPCTATTHYQSTPQTSTSNRVCTLIRRPCNISLSEIQLSPPTPTSDRVCSNCSCPSGLYLFTSNATTCSSACRPCIANNCSGGEEYAQNCTWSTYGKCVPCQTGFYKNSSGFTLCSRCSPSCNAGNYIVSNCTLTSNIVCKQCTTTCNTTGLTLVGSCSNFNTPSCQGLQCCLNLMKGFVIDEVLLYRMAPL